MFRRYGFVKVINTEHAIPLSLAVYIVVEVDVK